MVLAAVLVVCAPGAGVAGDTGYVASHETASLAARGLESATALPQPLSDADADRYRRIFDVQERGDWRAADKLIAALENDLLLGHVRAQRYLHPTKYRSRYKELKAWMQAYADHPDAARLYKLALRRKPANWRAPRPPVRIKGKAATAKGRATPGLPSKRLSARDRRRTRNLLYQMRRALRRGHTLVAKRLLQSPQAKRLLSAAEYDEASGRLAKMYYFDGRTDWAVKWAGAAAKRSGKLVPEAHWTLGLVAWRKGEHGAAADHFAAAAASPRADASLAAAAAFWAARGHLKSGHPERVTPLLERAAADRRGFYGLLARSVLGQAFGFRWTPPPMPARVVASLEGAPAGRRALALLQVGEIRRAERELRPITAAADRDLALGILGVAARSGMASLAVRLNDRLFPRGGGFDGAAYPIPEWMPADGFRVDRALVYALIRQESRFNPKAKSWAGARGLMQIVPGTARFVARANGMRWKGRRQLYAPETNLDLGQRYVRLLLNEKAIAGDLFLVAAAWNGGPGNLRKWQRRSEYADDPLHFLESIPNRETRHFVKKVLANLWVYRDRLGQPAPSLDAVARGKRPVYTPLGHGDAEVAEHGTRGG